ncbi:MAG: 16S rRNA (cytidine(1402)-2'-O)-methyltransferase [Candidatus Omnitrophota bacterium]|nr:MAG: 16S rRNA (cytidine(1402)-2'-O)-methyltransferase [Candidatus Omnitrophota bacterium]
MSGILYIVATPIGNLRDVTLRAIDTLKKADLIACEDTRHTRKLTTHYSIETRLISYFEYNKFKKSKYIIGLLKEGKSVALVSDAGTPGVSDPGYRLIKEAIANSINVTILPGPSAIISSLVVSGLPTDRFIFEGFLPNKSAARRKRLESFKDEKRTIVFYESPHRLVKCLNDMLEIFGNINIVCIRELTKKFEEIKRASLEELISYFQTKRPRGEFVILANSRAKR